ncbi:MAG: polysaccharide biosynthesis protein, partial [Phycisphaerae bacterium]|nr:polysaccharide biosynthesis protein [Phycisphaerae bacterium]
MAEHVNISTSESDIKRNPEASVKDVDGLLRHRRLLVVVLHVLSFTVSLVLSFLIVKDMRLEKSWLFYDFPFLLLLSLPAKLVVFGLFKQFRGWWRYVGISDLISIAKASLASTLIVVCLWSGILSFDFIRRGIKNIPAIADGVLILDLFTTIMVLGGLRMIVRLYYEEYMSETNTGLKKFLIIGAGDAGEGLLREMMRTKDSPYEVVGFIDDDPAKQGLSIHGVSVLGTVEQLPKICEKHNIEEIAIAMRGASPQKIRHVVQVCQGTKKRFRIVPSITDIASGKLKVSQIRDVDINDLLGRDEIELELNEIEKFINNKVVLVTGAGGSIGSEMCRQVCQFGPKMLLLVELTENPLFFIDRELRKNHPDVQMQAIICNISDRFRVNEVFAKYKPEVVIHAAAHKHVPLMETNPGEAIKNNVVGTRNLADASADNDVGHFVMISTDKAVNPTSLMGSSKRVAEMYVQDANRTTKTHFVTVRFGNVLGSNGSVVPIFKKQIAEGGPVTVTHPEMERYFMTIPEASKLVLQAATMGTGGEIFVLDMGESVKIVHLARELITLSGFRPDEDIEIKFTGMRPGEKLFEELSIEGEDMQPTRHPKIGIWKNIPKDRESLHNGIEVLIETAQTQNHSKIAAAIKKLIPE